MPVRVAIYARYSTDLQSERSIEDQVALARRIIRAEGLIEAGVFADRIKTSATLVGRSGLTDLMKAVESGNVDVVLVEHLDRISRDQADLATIYKKLKFHGVMLREVHGGEANAITVGVRGLMGSLFLTDLKDKVRRGLEGNVTRGTGAGGKAYGYQPVLGRPGELTIVPAEAAVIVEIFERYLAGETPKEIAYSLKQQGRAAAARFPMECFDPEWQRRPWLRDPAQQPLQWHAALELRPNGPSSGHRKADQLREFGRRMAECICRSSPDCSA